MNNYSKDNLKNYQVIKKETHNNINRYNDVDYNCGGFALGNFEWVSLENFSYSTDEAYLSFRENYAGDINEEYDYEEDEDYIEILQNLVEDVAEKCAYEILNEYKNTRLIESIDDLKKNEYAFCFRVGPRDFHFIRRFTNGQWAHKRGELGIEEIEEYEVFSDSWYHDYYPYSSKIYLFACKM